MHASRQAETPFYSVMLVSCSHVHGLACHMHVQRYKTEILQISYRVHHTLSMLPYSPMFLHSRLLTDMRQLISGSEYLLPKTGRKETRGNVYGPWACEYELRLAFPFALFPALGSPLNATSMGWEEVRVLISTYRHLLQQCICRSS